MNPHYIPRTNTQFSNRRLNSAQIYLLEMYNSQYNELMQQINARYIDATNIRHNMNAIIATTFPSVNPTPTNAANPANPTTFTAFNNARIHSPLRARAPGGLYGPSDFPTSWLRNNSFNSFFDRVDVSPSADQITTSTRTLRFGDIETPMNDRCPISFETFIPEDNVLQIIHCGHIFNPCEIAVWFRSNVGCPVCRYDIRNHRTNGSPAIPEETKEENGNQEHKDDDHVTTPVLANMPVNAQAQDNVDANTEALIEALLHVLWPATTGTRSATNTSSISYDPSNNMYFFDYYLDNRRS